MAQRHRQRGRFDNMRKFIIFLILITTANGQTGPHRKLYSLCSAFVSSGVINSLTNGQIGIGVFKPVIAFTEVFKTGDIILIGAANNGGSSSAINPVLTDTRGLTWNVIQEDFNEGIWYAVVGTGFTGTSVTVTFQHQSLNRSITGAHIAGSTIPSFGVGGNNGTFPTGPFFVFNVSNVLFPIPGSSGQTWIFGGLGVPTTATYLHGLFITVIVSAANGGTPPTNWTNIKTSGLPSTSISYSCSFP